MKAVDPHETRIIESMKKVVILGVNGYIGRHLAVWLQNQGAQITGYDIAPSLYPGLSGMEYRMADLSNAEVWKGLNLDCEELYCFSGLTGTSQGFDAYESFLKSNELLLLHLLNTLHARPDPPRVVFPSTRLVYSGREHAQFETEAGDGLKSVYAVNKFACEQYLSLYHRIYAIPYAVLRIGVPYGNSLGGDYSYGTLGMLIAQARSKGCITLYGDGSQRRTFTYIDDICRQLAGIALTPAANGKIFNCAGEEFSLREVAGQIAGYTHAQVVSVPFPDLAKKMESGSTVFESSKIEQLLEGQQQTVSLKDWLKNGLA